MTPALQGWLDSLRGLPFADALARVRAAGYVPVGPVVPNERPKADPSRVVYLYPEPAASLYPVSPTITVWFAEMGCGRGG